MAESKARRVRKRLAVELEAIDEALVRRARMQAIRHKTSLRLYVLEALLARVMRDEREC